MRSVILASMRTYARRYVAAFVAVLIATGFIVAINTLSAAAREGANETVGKQYLGADVAATDATGPRQYGELRTRALADPDVTAAAVNWRGWAEATLSRGSQMVSLGSVATDRHLRWQETRSGRLPTADAEIAISSSWARRHHVRLGDSLSIDAGTKPRAFTVTGIVDDQDGPLRSVLYVPERVFPGLGDIGAPVDEVFAVSGDPSAVASRLDRATSGVKVATADAYERTLRLQATNGIDVFQKLILVFAAISLFVGALVIANTFTILLAQRARDLALLRCVGAVRAQVARSVVVEGLVIGAVGAAAGVVLGYLIALGGKAAIGHWSPSTPMGGASLTMGSVLLPVLLGIAVTVAASYVPARRAGAQSPLAALQPQEAVQVRTRAGTLRLVTATGFLLAGAAGLLVGLQSVLVAGLIGGMLSFIGVLLLTPVLVPVAIRLVGPLARRAGVPGRLAHGNSMRNPRRTAATSAALLIGVTLITAVVVGSASISHKVNTSLDENHPIDLIAASAKGALPQGIGAKLAAVDGVKQAVQLPGVEARVGDQKMTILGVDNATRALVRGNVLRHLGPHDIMISGDTGTEASGETVAVKAGGTVRKLSVRYAAGIGDAAIVSRATLDAMGVATAPRAVWVRAADGADAGAVASDVASIAKESNLDLSGGLSERADILKLLAIVLAITVGFLAIAVLIALIGVSNTLSLSVLERVRENSLLRAMGLERSGLRAMLAIEALLMAGVSAVLGIGLGTLYAWFGVKTLSDGVFDSAPDLSVPWVQVGAIFLVAVGAGLVACVLPARQAARIAPAAGLVAD
ncbi:ABC transporter permease [Aeromicrobium ginsengisoli]|uniref:FtsX-like permease family protein n=1 Tax=Aeromicrobium ginsengisoli TaxID=363867 RepID=A0A5M4FGH4_9ACTN|nr:ABC transporter permease [Aeromicrobium ginsengisoli]KAA1397883.1 FtsX-like permease family protein [Aeromicrobium ginsengisoli]